MSQIDHEGSSSGAADEDRGRGAETVQGGQNETVAESTDSAGQGSGEPSRVKNADVARAWGTSAAYVSTVIKKKRNGVPFSSIEEANAWRAENSAGRGIGFRSKGESRTAAPAAGAGSAGGEASPEKPAAPATPLQQRVIPKRKRLRTVDDSLAAAIEIEEEARHQVAIATANNQDSRLPNLIAAYIRAQAGRYEAESRVTALKRENRELVPLAEAKLMIERVLGTLTSRLRSVPRVAAPQANPADDVHAENVIRKAIEDAIEEAWKEYGAVCV